MATFRVTGGVLTGAVMSGNYPDNSLPGDQPGIDNSLPGSQPGIDNSLPVPPPGVWPPPVPAHPIVPVPPGSSVPPGTIWPPVIDNTLPRPPYRPDNSLPGQQPGIDNTLPGQQPRPDQGLPGDQPGIDNTLPPSGWAPHPEHPIATRHVLDARIYAGLRVEVRRGRSITRHVARRR